MKKNYISALAVLACVAVFCTISGNSFHQMRTATEEIIPGGRDRGPNAQRLLP